MHAINSAACATPHPYPPPQEGAGALTSLIQRNCRRGYAGKVVIARSVATKQSRSRERWLLDCFASLAMTDQMARRRGRCVCSLGPSRSRPWRKFPTGRLCAFAGAGSCTMSRPSRGRSASPRPGGEARERRRATISAPRIRKGAASGSIARVCSAARRPGRNGLCMGCSGEARPTRALLTRGLGRTTCRKGP